MGSLMSGWDSPVLDPRKVKFERNKSLTKEEIAAYWRSKKKADGDDGEKELRLKVGNLQNVRAPSSPPALGNTKEGCHLEMEGHTISLEKLATKNGWWTRSESAFLNQPPVIATEGQPYKYASQFHVARIADSEPLSDAGIAA